MLFQKYKSEVRTINDKTDITEPKHVKSTEPKHRRAESLRPGIPMKLLVVLELILVILSCYLVYSIRCHNLEVRVFSEAYTAALANASDSTGTPAKEILQEYLEEIAEEVYEYAWTTEKVEYRKGAAMSYASAGTLDKNKLVRRTAITNGGWSRIDVDGEEYFLPEGKLSTETPEGLPISPGIKGEYQKYALSLLPDFGWDDSELEPLIYLWNRESGWNPKSHNKRSGAHGIPQALPASKMASEGSDYYTNPEPQIRWGLKYIAGRYGSPSAAWAHFCSYGWY